MKIYTLKDLTKKENKKQSEQVKGRLIKSIYAGFHPIYLHYSKDLDEPMLCFTDAFINSIERLDGFSVTGGTAALYTEYCGIDAVSFNPMLDGAENIHPMVEFINVGYMYRVPAYDKFKGAAYMFYDNQSYQDYTVSAKFYQILKEAQ